MQPTRHHLVAAAGGAGALAAAGPLCAEAGGAHDALRRVFAPQTEQLLLADSRGAKRQARPIGMAVAVAAALVAASSAHAASVQVQTDAGVLQGTDAQGVTRFLGIPYARPPVGSLRWRAPEPPAPWTGVRLADHLGAVCMQTVNRSDNGLGPGEPSEDCLTLNVFAPAAAKAAPVMVWIHGGGLVNGSGTAALYDGAALARQGVVVVTINYRLGRFGFFAHPALSAEAHGAPVANYGLMDQIEALRWVRRNISAFGGDPARVTVFGESAGGASVDRLMLIGEVRGLFAGAISESGVGSERSQTLAEAQADGSAFAKRLGVEGDDPTALRAIPAAAIVAAGDLSMSKGEAPILDGQLLREDPLPAFRAGHEAQVSYMTGSNSLEIPKAWAKGFRDDVAYTPAELARLQAAYPSPEAFRTRLLTDSVFAAPGRALAALHASHGAPSFLYRFSVASPAELKRYGGAIHASDRQYVFQTLAASPWPTTANDAAQARTLSGYWVQFAKTGDPNGKGRPAWPAYGPSDRLLHFTDAGPRAERTPDAAPLDAISSIQAAAPPR